MFQKNLLEYCGNVARHWGIHPDKNREYHCVHNEQQTCEKRMLNVSSLRENNVVTYLCTILTRELNMPSNQLSLYMRWLKRESLRFSFAAFKAREKRKTSFFSAQSERTWWELHDLKVVDAFVKQLFPATLHFLRFFVHIEWNIMLVSKALSLLERANKMRVIA